MAGRHSPIDGPTTINESMDQWISEDGRSLLTGRSSSGGTYQRKVEGRQAYYIISRSIRSQIRRQEEK
jgi:hypothetical protein